MLWLDLVVDQFSAFWETFKLISLLSYVSRTKKGLFVPLHFWNVPFYSSTSFWYFFTTQFTSCKHDLYKHIGLLKLKRKRNLKDPTRQLLDLINKFSKVAGHKTNIKKSKSPFIPISTLRKKSRNDSINNCCFLNPQSYPNQGRKDHYNENVKRDWKTH